MNLTIEDKFFNEEELKNTPDRYKRFLEEWLVHSNNFSFTVFENPGYDEMIIVKDISFYSMCSHHLVPFFGVAHFGYIPGKKICGLSKIPRTVDKYAHKPQVQEKLTVEIMQALTQKLQPKWAMLVMEAEHLCMSMRGIKKPGAKTITNTIWVHPEFKPKYQDIKQEFLKMIKD